MPKYRKTTVEENIYSDEDEKKKIFTDAQSTR